MYIPGDIFNEFTDQEAQLRQFLLFLRKRIPHGKFQLVVNDDSECLYGDNLVPSSKVRDTIVHRAQQEKGMFLYELNENYFVRSIFIQGLDAVLIYCLSKNGSDSFIERYEATVIQLSIELFLSRLPPK